jgi:hypothetical protein
MSKNNNKNNNNNNGRGYKQGNRKNYGGKDSRQFSKDRGGTMSYLANAGKDNDGSWYNRLPYLLQDVTKINFKNQLGVPVPIPHSEGGLEVHTVPGVMVLDMVHGPGYSDDVKSGINRAGINFYEKVRSALNKANTDYEMTDMAIVNFCKADLFTQFANIVRFFGLFSAWDTSNYYKPLALLQAGYGVNRENYQTIVERMPNLRERANYLALEASFLFLPSDYNIMDRWSWLFSNVWKDHDNEKAQFYIHRMHGYYKFNETLSQEGSAAEYIEYTYNGTGIAPIKEMLDAFESCINALRNSSSVRVIESDIKNAFPNDEGWKFPVINEGYRTPIMMSDEVNMQIENTCWLGAVWGLENNNITQNVDKDIIKYAPIVSSGGDRTKLSLPYVSGSHIINIHTSELDQAGLAVATRGLFYLTHEEDANYKVHCASDFCYKIGIVAGPSDTIEWQLSPVLFGGTGASEYSMLMFQSFDWAPKLWMALPIGAESMCIPFLEWDNYGIITDFELNNLNRVVTTSLWWSKVSEQYESR